MWRATLSDDAGRGDFKCVRSLISIVVLIALGSCASRGPNIQTKLTSHPAPTPTPSPTPALPDRAQEIKNDWPKLFEFSNNSIDRRFFDKHGYDLAAEYPELSSPNHKVRRFNKWIRSKILAYTNQFRRLADAEQRKKKKLKPRLWGLDLSYVIYFSNERLISLRLAHSVMEAGQMHPISYYETINYDLETGKQLRVRDIFKRGYLKRLSNYSRKELTERYALVTQDWMMNGTRPTAGNFTNWNLVPDGVLLSFEDYQVSAHSFGQPEFVVPFSALQGTLRRDIVRKLFT